jgi:hypothetical protein
MPDWAAVTIGVVLGMGLGLGIGYLALVWYFNKGHIW